ncbi:Surfactin synthase thioesterase subunit [Paenibacillus sp. UNC496MF]|uniref:thioesterase II family protein n=1 Tax=Paenibacillus sp. UNC496MF TaxID=1502753 RepID=UPI0008EE5C30|nr:thioesterase II family protein [Paenibacillus sp. UNC496MF]SFJ92621.1 Surfactin synthase thioesterase subunit [Paenibacillus sp. UNC496MF]
MKSALQSWFLNANEQSNANSRLFCFPYAGGGASIFRGWTQYFPNDIEVCPVQLPGRESRVLESPMISLSQIVKAIVGEIKPLLHTPFVFFGHSMGALIAYETAREIGRVYGKHPAHLFVSGRSSPQLPSIKKKLHQLPEDEFKSELRRLNGTPEAVLQNDDLMQLLMPRLRADFEVCETYSYIQDLPLPCPISAFGGKGDHDVSSASLAAWKEQTRSAFFLHMFDGDHFFLQSNQESIMQTVLRDMYYHAN